MMAKARRAKPAADHAEASAAFLREFAEATRGVTLGERDLYAANTAAIIVGRSIVIRADVAAALVEELTALLEPMRYGLAATNDSVPPQPKQRGSRGQSEVQVQRRAKVSDQAPEAGRRRKAGHGRRGGKAAGSRL